MMVIIAISVLRFLVLGLFLLNRNMQELSDTDLVIYGLQYNDQFSSLRWASVIEWWVDENVSVYLFLSSFQEGDNSMWISDALPEELCLISRRVKLVALSSRVASRAIFVAKCGQEHHSFRTTPFSHNPSTNILYLISSTSCFMLRTVNETLENFLKMQMFFLFQVLSIYSTPKHAI